jgi:hypothetical protein
MMGGRGGDVVEAGGVAGEIVELDGGAGGLTLKVLKGVEFSV